MAILSNGKFYGFLCSVKETGRQLANGVKEYVEDFVSGFAGHGWKLWEYVKGKWMLEIDSIRVRGQFTVFEMLISKVRAIIGAQTITQGCGKIKIVTLSEDGTAYLITLEDEDMSFMEHDFIRCQEFTGEKRTYHVEIESVTDGVIRIPISEFELNEEGGVTNPPSPGDDIVQFGNSSHDQKYAGRHSAIYMHADETGAPAIDFMADIYSKNWENTIKTRIGGNLPGTDGDRGFYCVNGKIMSVDESNNVVYQINPDGSASFARGKLKWSKDGSPQFTGTILMQVDEKNVWKVTEEGKNIVGNPNGQRVEIDGNDANIKIFNEKGNNTTKIEGNFYTNYKDVIPGEAMSATFVPNYAENIWNTPGTYSVERRKHLLKPEEDEYYSTSDSLYISFSNLGYNYDISVASSTIVNVRVRVLIVRTKTLATDAPQEHLMILDQTHTQPGSSIVLNPTTVYAQLEKGYYYRFRFMVNTDITVNSNSENRVFVSLNSLNIRSYYTDYYGRFFSNGILIGTSDESQFSVFSYIDGWRNEALNAYIYNKKAGFKVEGEEAYIRQNGIWGMAIATLAVGFINFRDGKPNVELGVAMIKTGWTATKLQIGRYKISFPVGLGITSGAEYYVMTIGSGAADNSTTAAVKANLYEKHETYFVIDLSDDATPNDGSCYFEMKLFK